MKSSTITARIALHLGLGAWLLLACLPIFWMVLISLRDYVDAFSSPLKWVAPITFENYRRLWVAQAFYLNFFNTAGVTLSVVTVSLAVGCRAGYAFSR